MVKAVLISENQIFCAYIVLLHLGWTTTGWIWERQRCRGLRQNSPWSCEMCNHDENFLEIVLYCKFSEEIASTREVYILLDHFYKRGVYFGAQIAWFREKSLSHFVGKSTTFSFWPFWERSRPRFLLDPPVREVDHIFFLTLLREKSTTFSFWLLWMRETLNMFSFWPCFIIRIKFGNNGI